MDLVEKYSDKNLKFGI